MTSIDREHLDHYSSFEAVQDAFVEFANKVPFYGSAIVAIDVGLSNRKCQPGEILLTGSASPDRR